MNQDQKNALWKKEYGPNGSYPSITFLEAPANPKRPSHLKNRYQWEISKKQAETLLDELKLVLKPFKNRLQCDLVDKRTISKGIRLNVFLLGYKVCVIR